MHYRNTVEFAVFGRYALFSDPLTRMGGEKLTYQIPTYQALKGILESVYWKPTILWVMDCVRVMKPIRTEAKSIRPIHYNDDKNDLSVYTYLSDVRYHVRAHFVQNPYRPELDHDYNEHKHHNIARRMISKGGRRDVFLGTRECQGYVEECAFDEGKGFYDEYGTLDFGLMFHGFDYPDETGRDMLAARFWRPKMVNGVIDLPAPGACDSSLRRDIRPMRMKRFEDKRNFSGLREAAVARLLEEVSEDGLDADAVRNI